MPAEASPHLYQRKLILFSGKGGVGKTTIASAFALSCARRGQKTLLMELNTRDRVSSMFGTEAVGSTITPIDERLFAVNVTPEAAQQEYAMMMLKLRVVYRAIFENRIVRSFLRAIPGLNELVMLGKAYYHTIETDDDGRPTWDKVVVDAPATGHGIFLLQIPDVITSILSSGHMYEEARRIQAVMRDPAITAMNLVTLPEEMPVNETQMLHRSTIDDLGLPPGVVVANGVYPDLFTAEDRAHLDAARDELSPGSLGRDLLEAADFRAMRGQLQRRYLDTIDRELPLPCVHVPYYFVERLDFQVLSKMADVLAEALGEPEP